VNDKFEHYNEYKPGELVWGGSSLPVTELEALLWKQVIMLTNKIASSAV
jgi:hypothetical protein